MGASLAPVIIATDKTQLTQFSGGKLAYPVYLTLGNIPRSIRRKPSQHACILIAYLSVSKEVGKDLTKKQKSARIQQLFHDSMRLVLQPLIQAGKDGMEVTGGDGRVQQVHSVLACYVADYPEQCLVTCAKYGTCPKCKTAEEQLEERIPEERRTQRDTSAHLSDARINTTSHAQFQRLCKENLLSGGVRRPFWEGFPHCDIHLSITSGVLHQLYQGVVKHLTTWCSSLMDDSELDSHLRTLPPCFGVRHFTGGWSNLSQISGKEHKDMARVLLGCMVGKVPSKVITAYCALLDFLYLAQYPSHDDNTLQYMEDSLDLFHKTKSILTSPDLNIREHLNIPKFHSLLHYVECIKNFGTTDNYNTEMFERFHIDMAKEGWHASNFRNEVPQMTKWLSRQEKVTMFESYLAFGEEETVEREEPSKSPLKGLIISQCPSVHNQMLTSIQVHHHCPSFSHHLRLFLNSLMPSGQAIPRSQVAYARLPFDRVDVWHTCKFTLDTLGNDIDATGETDVVKAKPSRAGGRFDVVIVANTDIARATGLEGEPEVCYYSIDFSFNSFLTGIKIGRIRVIFKLPSRTSLVPTSPSWPTGPLAHIEWYNLSSHPGQHHNMYSVSKPSGSQEVRPGAIVPLNTIRQTCQLIPLAPTGHSWPRLWCSQTVLDNCNTFLLNNWASKYAYQTLW